MANLLVPHAPGDSLAPRAPRADGAADAEAAMDLEESAAGAGAGAAVGVAAGADDGGSAMGLVSWLGVLTGERLVPPSAEKIALMPPAPSPPVALFLRNIAEVARVGEEAVVVAAAEKTPPRPPSWRQSKSPHVAHFARGAQVGCQPKINICMETDVAQGQTQIPAKASPPLSTRLTLIPMPSPVS